MLFPLFLFSQEKIEGTIMESNANNNQIGLFGANVHWLNTSIGAVTDFEGKFTISYKKEYTKLIISYIGFKTDTLVVGQPIKIIHFLTRTNNLEEVVIENRKKTTSFSYLNSMNILNILQIF